MATESASRRYYYRAVLLDPVSMSASHSSDYSQICLDCIPGSAVAGALAGRLYRGYARENKERQQILDRLFQNNEAVFANALPLTDEGLAVLPAPSCLYYEKGTEEGVAPYVNRAATQQGEKQLKQVRSGYLNSVGGRHSVRRSSVTKTAIDRTTKTASDSQLFTLNFIEPGTVFWGYADIPQDVAGDPELAGEITSFLNSVIRIGKCRSSEFGRVRLELLDQEQTSGAVDAAFHAPANLGDRLCLWCLSDVEFVDLASGAGTFVPQASNLWLGDDQTGKCTFCPEKSFIRTSRIRSFNRKRNGYDGEKCLVKRGSIIAFELKNGGSLDTADLVKIAREGIGLGRHQGLGRVLVNPAWIDREILEPGKPGSELFPELRIPMVGKTGGAACAEACEGEYGYLETYVARRSADDRKLIDFRREAADIIEVIRDLYLQARQCNSAAFQGGAAGDADYGPNNSQWSQIHEAVIRGGSDDGRKLKDCAAENNGVEDKLKGDSEKQRETNRTTWDVHFAWKGNANTTFAKEFMDIARDSSLGALKLAFDKLRLFDLSKPGELTRLSREMRNM